MPRYKYGLVFNFYSHVRQFDSQSIFVDVDHHRLLTHVVKFLTEDVWDKRMGKEQLNEMEYLIGILYDQGIISDYLVDQKKMYLSVYQVLFAICESLVMLFEDTGLFQQVQDLRQEPIIIQNNKHNFTIVLKGIR